jgi:hypothetical protein
VLHPQASYNGPTNLSGVRPVHAAGLCGRLTAMWVRIRPAHTAYSYATGQAWNDVETRESMDDFMKLAVNDHECVYGLVREFKHRLPEELMFLLPWDMVDVRSY